MTLKKKEKDWWEEIPKEKFNEVVTDLVNKKEKKKKKKKKSDVTTPKMKEEIASEIIKKFPEEEEKKENPNGPGRPPKITASVLQKLKVCFSVDMTNEQAAYFCGIWERTLQYYLSENPDFLQEKEILKSSISLQAKFNIGRAIKTEEAKPYGWTGNSWKRLEKKDPEFRETLRIEKAPELSPESEKLKDKLALWED